MISPWRKQKPPLWTETEPSTTTTPPTIPLITARWWAKNTYGSLLQFTAQKNWHGIPAASLPLELQYLAVENGKEVWKSFPTPATVELDGTADPTPATDPYYENTPADSAV